MEAIGPLLIVLAIPLVLRLVPPNPLYGFRVPPTRRNQSVWYDANALHGRHMVLLGLALVGLEFVVPRSLWRLVLGSTATLGLLLVVIADWRTANRWERERRHTA